MRLRVQLVLTCALLSLLRTAFGSGTWHDKLGAHHHTNPNQAHLDVQPIPDNATAASEAAGASGDTWETCSKCAQCTPTVPVPITLWRGRDPSVKAPDIPPATKECDSCTGCTVKLERLTDTVPFQPEGWQITKPTKVFLGASGAAVLRGQTTEGEVVVKMWCGIQGQYSQTQHRKDPLPLICQDDPAHPKHTKCKMKTGAYGKGWCNFEMLSALDALYVAANLTAVVPRSWTAPVVSAHPGPHPQAKTTQAQSKGVRISTMGQFSEMAPGVSLEAYTAGAASPEKMKFLLRIPKWQVQMAAVADLLFSEEDRHGQNVMLSEAATIMLIDNDGAFGPLNSMFLPGTQKYEIYRIGYGAVCCNNLGPGKCPGKEMTPSPEHIFDYRCWVEGGAMGTQYPPGVMEFLLRVKGMGVDSLQAEFGLPFRKQAEILFERATWMHDLGMEEALNKVLEGQPKGDGRDYGNRFSYDIHPPCCDWRKCKFRQG